MPRCVRCRICPTRNNGRVCDGCLAIRQSAMGFSSLTFTCAACREKTAERFWIGKLWYCEDCHAELVSGTVRDLNVSFITGAASLVEGKDNPSCWVNPFQPFRED